MRLILCTLFMVTTAQAATLRPVTTLAGPVVFLRDLFDDAGTEANRALGPSPSPGGRIVVEAAQLRAIARQFDVDWYPVSSADRAVLERPGQPLNRDLALAAVRAALMAAGTSPDSVVELTGFTPPLVPPGATPRPIVSQLDYDSRGGRFSALLSVAGEGMEPVNQRINGQVREMVDLPVAVARMSAGRVLGPDDLHIVRINTNNLRGEIIHHVEQIIGQQLTRTVQPGQPLSVGDLTRPTMVRRGALVRLQLESRGLSVTGQGVALEAGAEGERIKVQNPGTRIILEGVVIGPNLVRVAPNISPEAASARGNNVYRQ